MITQKPEIKYTLNELKVIMDYISSQLDDGKWYSTDKSFAKYGFSLLEMELKDREENSIANKLLALELKQKELDKEKEDLLASCLHKNTSTHSEYYNVGCDYKPSETTIVICNDCRQVISCKNKDI